MFRNISVRIDFFSQIRRTLSIALLILTMGLTACATAGDASQTSAPTTYIAMIDDAPVSARAVIVIEDGRFSAYICSLDDAFNLKTARWFEGEIAPDGAVSGSSDDGVQFQGTIDDSSFTGTIINMEGRIWTFNGSAVPSGGPAGLYHGVGNYNGQEFILGAVIDSAGSFASTAQVRGKLEFVTPVASAPVRVDATTIMVTIGDPGQQIEAILVTTLKGEELFSDTSIASTHLAGLLIGSNW